MSTIIPAARITYDKNGNRLTDTYYLKPLKALNAAAGSAEPAPILVKDTYAYDNLNRIASITRQDISLATTASPTATPARPIIVIDQRTYDAASRLVSTGPSTLSATGVPNAAPVTLAQYRAYGVTGEMRVSTYNNKGHLAAQTIYSLGDDKPNAPANQQDSSANTIYRNDRRTGITYQYTGNGLLKQSYVGNPGQGSEYNYWYQKNDGYQLSATSAHPGSRNAAIGAITRQFYDVNHQLIAIDSGSNKNTDPATFIPYPSKTRVFVNDLNGRVLEKASFTSTPTNAPSNNTNPNEANRFVLGTLARTSGINLNGANNTSSIPGNTGVNAINPANTNKGLVDVTHILVANNEVMAESGGDRETANFNARFRQIDANYPSAAPSTYTAVKGDTLISVARAVWGDGSLRYLIADANGLSSPDSLTDGQSLVIPNKVANINNNVSTFAPYDPSKIIGDTTPATPPPPPPSASNGDKCGGFGQVLVVVVAVAVTLASGGVGAAFAGSLGLTGGAATAVSFATAAAIGNVAAQATANIVGIQNGFDIRQTLVAAGSAAITAGVLGNFGGASASLGDQVIRGAANSVINQGLRIATGLQSSFSWAQVAGSAIAAPIVNGLTDRLLGQELQGPQQLDANGNVPTSTLGRLPTAFTDALGRTAANVITNTLAGTVSQVIVTRFTGGKLNYANIAADAFGNAIANQIGDDIGNSIAAQQQRGKLEEARLAAAARSDFMEMAQNRPSSIGPLIPTTVDINLPPLPEFNVAGNMTSANNVRIAARGDSYARMARDAYGDERYALALAQYNGARSSTLQLGARVELPNFDSVDLRRGGDFLANDAAMRQAAANRAPVDPTDGMRAGPTLARSASQNAAGANAPTIGELITSLQPYSDLQRMGAVDYRLANPVNMVPEARGMTDESSLRGRLIESMRASSFGESNAGQVAIGALNRYLTLGESSVGAVGALFNLPGNAYAAIEEKGIGRATLDGYNGVLTGVRQSFFNVAYGLNGESRGALAFDLVAGAGVGAGVRGVNGLLVDSEVSALQRIAANNRIDTGSTARMARIDELSTTNYNRILNQDLAGSEYVYRLVKSSDIKYYEAANAITGRGGSPTYFSLDTAATFDTHMFGAQMKPNGYDTLLRIPSSEIVSPQVPRAFGYDNPVNRPTFGREYFTNSYPQYGQGGFRQFEATTRSYSPNWIVR